MNIRVLYHSSQYLLPVVNPPNLFTFIFSTLNIEYIFIVLRICDFSSFVFFFLRVLPTLSFIFCCRATDVPSMFWKRISRIHLFPFRDFFFFCFFFIRIFRNPSQKPHPYWQKKTFSISDWNSGNFSANPPVFTFCPYKYTLHVCHIWDLCNKLIAALLI